MNNNKGLREKISEIIKDVGLEYNTWSGEIVENKTNEIMEAVKEIIPEKELNGYAKYVQGWNECVDEIEKQLG